MKAIIKNNIFTMKTQGCEVEILKKLDNKCDVKILTQPNKHKKAIPVGKVLNINNYDLEFIQ